MPYGGTVPGSLAPGQHRMRIYAAEWDAGNTQCTVPDPLPLMWDSGIVASELEVTFCPVQVGLPPPVPDIPTPPDVPAPTPLTCSTLDDVCGLIGFVLSDLQHLFAQVGRLRTDLFDTLTAIAASVQSAVDGVQALITSISDLRALTLDLSSRVDDIGAQTTTLTEMFNSVRHANLGCPPADITGTNYPTWLINSLEALNTAICSREPAPPSSMGVLTSGSLLTGSNEITLPAGARLLRVDLVGIPIGWGWQAATPREYQPLGWASRKTEGGYEAPIVLRYQASGVEVRGSVPIEGVNVYLYPPISGTFTVYGG